MIRDMEKLGSGRRSFSLRRPPPRLYTTTFRGDRGSVDVFQPHEENLPLEAGFYTFVIDDQGHFRVRRGNSSSHASFTRCGPVGAAGNFRINRAGNVAEVFCISLDYRIFVADPGHPTARYLIDSFRDHHALEASPLALFRFKGNSHGTFHVGIDGRPVDDIADRLRLLEAEGRSGDDAAPFTPAEIAAFVAYHPAPPPRLYGMHRDQFIADLESAEDAGFEIGPGRPHYAPDQTRMAGGKWAFVIDRDGWLVVGSGHHILSGGSPVGAAGQVVVEPSGAIGEVDLNFSGHYRPPLDGGYARYTYRAIAAHPLQTLSPDCQIKGRKFEGLDVHSTRMRFLAEELTADDPMLDLLIESA